MRSQAQQELAKQAMRLEILLGQTASSRPGVLDLLQVRTRLMQTCVEINSISLHPCSGSRSLAHRLGY